MDFTRENIVAALTEVGEALYARRKIGDIAVFGGSAMILQFDVDFITPAVDAVIDAEHGAVIAAVQEVARRRDWPSGWLNEGVSVYLSPERETSLELYGEFPSPERVGLRVYVAKPEYLLAMKLQALRTGGRDVADVMTLAGHLGVKTVEQLADIVSRSFPQNPLDARKRLLLLDIAARLES